MVRGELEAPEARALGGRQVRNVVEQRFKTLATWLSMNGHVDANHVRVWFDGPAMVAVVDDEPSEIVAS
jgi:hypothetical protein